MGAVSSVKMVLTVGDNPSWAARAHRIEHVEEANDWLTTGSRGTGFMDNKFDPLAGVIQTPQHEADTPGSAVPKLDLSKLAQLAEHSQSLMEQKKGEIFGRVDSWYATARTRAKEESAQLFVVQQQQRDALRAEFVARTKDHTKRMQAEEYKNAVSKAKSINIRISLDTEFQAYCEKRRV